MAPEGLHILRKLPHLPDCEIALIKNAKPSKAGAILVEHITKSFKS
jgi:hypothetical protein